MTYRVLLHLMTDRVKWKLRTWIFPSTSKSKTQFKRNLDRPTPQFEIYQWLLQKPFSFRNDVAKIHDLFIKSSITQWKYSSLVDINIHNFQLSSGIHIFIHVKRMTWFNNKYWNWRKLSLFINQESKSFDMLIYTVRRKEIDLF